MSEPTEMKPRAAEKREATNSMRCPHCGTDPMNVGMRPIPVPPPPAITRAYVVTFGCANPECRSVINTQIVTPEMMEAVVGKMPTLFM